jgi:hypothetical protein
MVWAACARSGGLDRCHCAGKIALFLEGGYDIQAGKACSLAAIAALLGEPGMIHWTSGDRGDWKGVLEQAE